MTSWRVERIEGLKKNSQVKIKATGSNPDSNKKGSLFRKRVENIKV